MSSSNRRSYLTATVLDQALLDACADNLECRLEMVCEIETPSGVIYASDRNKYVGGIFYEALLTFPVISRTVGEWLSNELQFSNLTLSLSNVDGRFNNFLQGGVDFGGWIGKSVVVKVGLAEQSATYTEIFRGRITPVGGFKRSTKTITVVARDENDKVNVEFPGVVIKDTTYPKIESKNVGKVVPIIYGDWTVETDPVPASVPAYAVNGHDPFVHFKPVDVTLTGGTPGVCEAQDHDLDNLDIIQFETSGSLPSPLVAGINYYVRNATADTFNLSLLPAGALINFGGPQSGDHKFKPGTSEIRGNVQLLISGNDLLSLDVFYLKRGDEYFEIPGSEVVNVGAGNRTFEILQDSAVWFDDGSGPQTYKFEQGDEFVLKLVGKDLGAYTSNVVWIARDLLMTYGGVLSGDFHANWTTYRDKASPAQSAIATIKGRAHIATNTPLVTYVLSLLEQVRLEAFIDRNLKVKLNSLHFEDWVAAPTYTVKDWDVETNSFQTSIDERNNFNRAQAIYNLLPNIDEEARSTGIFRNSAAITQAGQAISKKIAFPNLYVKSDVENQLMEVLKLASSTLEIAQANLTWRALLKDIGDFVKLDVRIGSTIYEGVPCMIREIGNDPQGMKIPVKVWSFQMVPFPGWAPGYAGIVGGNGAAITQE